MRKQTEKPLFPFWAEDRGLSFFLAFLVIMTIFVPMLRMSRYGRIGVRRLTGAIRIASGKKVPRTLDAFVYDLSLLRSRHAKRARR